jgi:DNA-binding transcriptional MerR regulator
MSLDEIRVLLRVQDTPADECGEVSTLLDQHIGHVVDRIRELRGLERQLRALRARCGSATDAAHCGILSELSVAASRSPAHPGTRRTSPRT